MRSASKKTLDELCFSREQQVKLIINNNNEKIQNPVLWANLSEFFFLFSFQMPQNTS